jgi:hypothetical protein
VKATAYRSDFAASVSDRSDLSDYPVSVSDRSDLSATVSVSANQSDHPATVKRSAILTVKQLAKRSVKPSALISFPSNIDCESSRQKYLTTKMHLFRM